MKVDLLVRPSGWVPLELELGRFGDVRGEFHPLRRFGDLSIMYEVRPPRRCVKTSPGLFIGTGTSQEGEGSSVRGSDGLPGRGR